MTSLVAATKNGSIRSEWFLGVHWLSYLKFWWGNVEYIRQYHVHRTSNSLTLEQPTIKYETCTKGAKVTDIENCTQLEAKGHFVHIFYKESSEIPKLLLRQSTELFLKDRKLVIFATLGILVLKSFDSNRRVIRFDIVSGFSTILRSFCKHIPVSRILVSACNRKRKQTDSDTRPVDCQWAWTFKPLDSSSS